MSAGRTASGRQLWKINDVGLLGEAVKRSPDGVLRSQVARELLDEWFQKHPEQQKPRTAKSNSRPKRHRMSESDKWRAYRERHPEVFEDMARTEARLAELGSVMDGRAEARLASEAERASGRNSSGAS